METGTQTEILLVLKYARLIIITETCFSAWQQLDMVCVSRGLQNKVIPQETRHISVPVLQRKAMALIDVSQISFENEESGVK